MPYRAASSFLTFFLRRSPLRTVGGVPAPLGYTPMPARRQGSGQTGMLALADVLNLCGIEANFQRFMNKLKDMGARVGSYFQHPKVQYAAAPTM